MGRFSQLEWSWTEARYEAYGKARHGWPEDLDGSGSVTQADRDIGGTCDAGAIMGDAGYNVLVDLDFSGDLDSNEVARCEWSSNAAALDAGAISDPDFDDGPWSAAGYDGYIYDDIADLSCVRFRWYNAGLGRWMTRDPAGYVDGANLVQNVSSSPVGRSDATGLAWTLMGSADESLPNPPTDEPLQPAFGSNTAPAALAGALPLYAQLRDLMWWAGLASQAAREAGNTRWDLTEAVQFATHWLGATGRNLRNNDWDIRSFYRGVPSYRRYVDGAFSEGLSEVESYLAQADAFAVREGSWNNLDITRAESPNWYFAFRGYSAISHFVVAAQSDGEGGMRSMTTCQNGSVQSRSASFFTTVFKAYNFDPGNVFNFPGALPGVFTGGTLQTFHAVGLARNYNIFGQMGKRIRIEYSMDSSGWVSITDFWHPEGTPPVWHKTQANVPAAW